MGTADGQTSDLAAGRRLWPLYAAGFTTAFGAHGIAANLGNFTSHRAESLLVLGGLLALYDGTEVLLKPVFGTLADRVGARPVLLGGLIAFAIASAAFVFADTPGLLWLARFGRGAAASAFSPAASTLVPRLNPAAKHGRAFGSYGFYKNLRYTAGPLLGGVTVAAGGLPLLFTVMTALAAAVAAWATMAVPAVPPLPRARQTVLDLARRLSRASFLRPTTALACAAIGTLVERTIRYAALVHLPRQDGYGVVPRTKKGPPLAGYGAVTMTALAGTIGTLPEQRRRSLTWDRGKELSHTPSSRSRAASRSASPTRTAPHSAAPTRTRTACCANTSQKALSFLDGRRRKSRRSLPHSAVDPARASVGRHPPKPSTTICYR